MRDRIKRVLVAGCILLLSTIPAFGQCAMCKAVVEGSPDAQAAAAGLNLAVLVLLIPPVSVFIGIFVIFYRNRNANRPPLHDDLVEGLGPSPLLD